MLSSFLTFSDSAKFAEAAKNLIASKGLTVHHSFFDLNLVKSFTPGDNFSAGFLPLPSYVLALFFKFFPPSDRTVILVGCLFFALSALLTYLITKKLHSPKAALISTLLYLFNPFFINYATNTTSEIFFIFEILLFIYLFLLKIPLKFFSLLPLVLLFFTRPQAVIVLIAIFLFAFWLILPKIKQTTKVFAALSLLLVFLTIIFISNRYQRHSLSPFKSIGTVNLTAGETQGNYLRGQAYSVQTWSTLASKTFYNLYNFAKAPSRLASPVILVLFFLSLFIKFKPKTITQLNLFTIIVFSLFLLASSATLPNARYIHPIIPLVIISASISLVEIIKSLKIKQKDLALAVLTSFIILPSVGNLTLDVRFRRQQFNLDKPPVYQVIADTIAQDLPQDKLIITNLDAWVAWYHGLTTMWFPLEPDMLKPTQGQDNKVDYIVITNYLENDPDFALGFWKEVVYSPENIKNKFLKENYQVLKTFKINPDQSYQNQEYLGTILIKK